MCGVDVLDGPGGHILLVLWQAVSGAEWGDHITLAVASAWDAGDVALICVKYDYATTTRSPPWTFR